MSMFDWYASFLLLCYYCPKPIRALVKGDQGWGPRSGPVMSSARVDYCELKYTGINRALSADLTLSQWCLYRH